MGFGAMEIKLVDYNICRNQQLQIPDIAQCKNVKILTLTLNQAEPFIAEKNLKTEKSFAHLTTMNYLSTTFYPCYVT